MSPASFLLRLLLAVSLVVTTTGGALASMRMHLGDSSAMATVAQPAGSDAGASAGQDCHEASDAGDQVGAAELPAAPADHGDCCLGGDCDGICLLSLPPLPSLAFLAPAAPTTQPYRTEAHPDRPAPRLTRPQRPPIT